jgi:hypothetical protein
MYMEVSQGNSLCRYLKQTEVSFFFLLQNRRTGGQKRSCLRGSYQWKEERCREKVQEGKYSANTVYTYIKMEKNETCCNHYRNGGRRIKKNDNCMNFCK